MMRTGFAASALLAGLAGGTRAAEPVTPPSMYPPDAWEGRSAAIVRVLDKLDAHVQTLTIPAGQTGTYKSLGIVVRSCLQHPPGLPQDAAAFLSVHDRNEDGVAFAGWMFSAEPFVAVFESPVYGVQLVSCDGADVAPAAPPLLPPPASAPATPDTVIPGAAKPVPDAPSASGNDPDPVYPTGTPDPPAPADGPAPPPN